MTFFRIPLNEISTIQLPFIDADQDFVRCSLSTGIELGELVNANWPGVDVDEVRFRSRQHAGTCTFSLKTHLILVFNVLGQTNLQWTVPELSILIINNSTWLILV